MAATFPSLNLRSSVLTAVKYQIAATFAIIIGTISTVFYKPLVTKIHTLHNLPGEWHPFDGGSADIRFSDTIKYSEDIVIDNDRGIAIISFDPGRSEWNTVMVNSTQRSKKVTFSLLFKDAYLKLGTGNLQGPESERKSLYL